MDEIAIYTGAVISILGVAYPILLQVIARLDQTYSSSMVIELFESEPRKIWFERLLVVSLVIVFIWSLKLEPIEPLSKMGYLVDNSAAILVVISTVLLVVVFILLVKRIYVYYVPSKFVNYLIKKHHERR